MVALLDINFVCVPRKYLLVNFQSLLEVQVDVMSRITSYHLATSRTRWTAQHSQPLWIITVIRLISKILSQPCMISNTAVGLHLHVLSFSHCQKKVLVQGDTSTHVFVNAMTTWNSMKLGNQVTCSPWGKDHTLRHSQQPALMMNIFNYVWQDNSNE